MCWCLMQVYRRQGNRCAGSGGFVRSDRTASKSAAVTIASFISSRPGCLCLAAATLAPPALRPSRAPATAFATGYRATRENGPSTPNHAARARGWRRPACESARPAAPVMRRLERVHGLRRRAEYDALRDRRAVSRAGPRRAGRAATRADGDALRAAASVGRWLERAATHKPARTRRTRPSTGWRRSLTAGSHGRGLPP